MPILKIVDHSKIRAGSQTGNSPTMAATTLPTQSTNNSSPQTAAFPKLRSTGLLQEHLRRDATPNSKEVPRLTPAPTKDKSSSYEELSHESPADLLQVIQSLKKVGNENGDSQLTQEPNYRPPGTRRNTISAASSPLKANFATMGRSRANSEAKRPAAENAGGTNTDVGTAVQGKMVKTLSETLISHPLLQQGKESDAPREINSIKESSEVTSSRPDVKQVAVNGSTKATPSGSRKNSSAEKRTIPLKEYVQQNQDSSREKSEFSNVFSRIKLGSQERLNQVDLPAAPTTQLPPIPTKEPLQKQQSSESVKRKGRSRDMLAADDSVSVKSVSNIKTTSDSGMNSPSMTRFSPAKVESFKYDDDSRESSADANAMKELKDVLHHLSLSNVGFDTIGRKKTQKIVSATGSAVNPRDGELDYREGDVLLVTGSSDRDGWVMARHEASGRSGLAKTENLRDMNSFFAEIVALADDEPSAGTGSRLAERTNSAPGGTNDGGSSRHPHLKELSKNSKFNLSIENDVGNKRARTPTLEETWSKRVGEDVIKLIDNQEKKRQEAIYEYIETEKSFLEDMQMVLDGYLKPLKEARVLSEFESGELFSNLPQIVTISADAVEIFSVLQYNLNGIIENIGELLMKELPKLREYAPFCSNLSRAVHYITEKKAESAPFAEKMAECAKNPDFRNMDLQSYLLKPMQRITKIPLLIKGILKYTKQDSPDLKYLAEAEAVSQEILLFINSKCGEADELRKLQKIQRKLNDDLISDLGLDYLDERKRKIVYGGPIECNDKKAFLYLFDDCLIFATMKMANKVERYSLFRPIISLWLLEVNPSETSPTSRPTTPRKSTSRIMKSPREPAKSFTLFDPQADVYYECVASSTRDKDTWLKCLSLEQARIQSKALFKLQKLKGLPIYLPNSKSKKPLTYEYFSGLRLGDYYVVGHSEGLVASRHDTSTEFLDCPGFSSSVGQLMIDENISFLIISESKSNNLEAYPTQSVLHLLNFMFDKSRQGGSPPGMKVSKLPGSKGSTISASALIDDVPHVVSAASKSISLFQFSPVGQQFKKVNEFHIPEYSDCNCITYMKSNICFGVGNKFYLLDIENRSLSEIVDESLTKQVEGSQALACFSASDKSVLLCYDNIGVLVDVTSQPYKPERYYVWRQLATNFDDPLIEAFEWPYVTVYSKNFVEVWNAKKATIKQIIHTPGMKMLNAKGMLFTISDGDNMNVLSYLEKEETD